jgi:hypothetical protein
MKQIKIRIHDGITPYKITPESYILGRRYENAATEVVIERPEAEAARTCVCVVEANGKTIDNIPVVDDKFVITSNLSQFASVVLGFVFFDGEYVQTTECDMFQFAPALRPLDFAPLAPESAKIIFDLTDKSFTRINYEPDNKNVAFQNITGVEVARVRLPFATEGELDAERQEREAETTDIRGKMVTGLTLNGQAATIDNNIININIKIIDGGNINNV